MHCRWTCGWWGVEGATSGACGAASASDAGYGRCVCAEVQLSLLDREWPVQRWGPKRAARAARRGTVVAGEQGAGRRASAGGAEAWAMMVHRLAGSGAWPQHRHSGLPALGAWPASSCLGLSCAFEAELADWTGQQGQRTRRQRRNGSAVTSRTARRAAAVCGSVAEPVDLQVACEVTRSCAVALAHTRQRWGCAACPSAYPGRQRQHAAVLQPQHNRLVRSARVPPARPWVLTSVPPHADREGLR